MFRGLKWSGFSVGNQLAYWHWQVARQQLTMPSKSDPETILKNSLQATPENPELHFQLGFVLHQAGDYLSAERCYERALAFRPNNCLYLEHRGRLHFEKKEFHKSIQVLKDAIHAGPVQPMTVALLGKAYYETCNYSKAMDCFQHLLALELPKEVEGIIRHQLILVLIAEGNLGSARRACLALLETHELEYELLMQFAESFLDINCLSPAKEILCHLIRRREEYLPARQKYGEIISKENEIEDLLPGIYASDEEVALRQVSRLMRFGHEKIAKAFLSLRSSGSALIRESVVEYCSRYGYLPWEDVAEFLNDPSCLVREKAVAYLSRFAPSSMRESMQQALTDSSATVRGYAARFFKQHGTMDIVEQLSSALEVEETPCTRIKFRAAITAIQRRNPAQGMHALAARLTLPKSPALDRVSIWAVCSLLAGVILLSAILIFK